MAQSQPAGVLADASRRGERRPGTRRSGRNSVGSARGGGPTGEVDDVRHGFWIRNGLEHGPERCVALARAAEAGGWDGVFLSDAVMEDHDDPFVLLAAMATTTERIALGTWVTPLVARDVVAVARAAAGVDRLSGGRLVLGLGLGNEVEHRGLGVPRRDLAGRHEVALDVLDRLLRGEEVTVHDEHRDLDGVALRTLPVQTPRPPLLLALSWPNRRGTRRAAAWDGLMPQWPGLGEGADPDVPEGSRAAQLRAIVDAYRSAGGDGTILVPRLDRFGPAYDELCRELGVSWLLTCDRLDEVELRAGPGANGGAPT